MELTDFMPVDKWVELQEEVHARFHLNADVMDKEGKRVSDNSWGNDLCRDIRSDAKGFSTICAPAGQMCKHLLLKSCEPFAEKCDAGMMRICVPVIKDGELLGAVGGCGVVPAEGEVDWSTIDMMSDLDADSIKQMAGKVAVASDARVREIQTFIQERVASVLG